MRKKKSHSIHHRGPVGLLLLFFPKSACRRLGRLYYIFSCCIFCSIKMEGNQNNNSSARIALVELFLTCWMADILAWMRMMGRSPELFTSKILQVFFFICINAHEYVIARLSQSDIYTCRVILLSIIIPFFCVCFIRDLSNNRIKFIVPGSLASLAHLSEL